MKSRTILAYAFLALPGCASIFQEDRGLVTEPQNTLPRIELSSNVYKQSEPKSRSSSEYNFSLEHIVINGKKYSVKENIYQRPNESSFILQKEEDEYLTIDRQNKTSNISSDIIYIPTQQVKQEKRGTITNEILITEARLEKSGKFGVKAKRKYFDIGNVGTGIIESNQDDIVFDLKTIFIGYKNSKGEVVGQEFYAPRALKENGEVDDNSNLLPDFLIPVDNTKNDIFQDGTIRLRNTDTGLLRGQRISLEDYKKRNDAKPEPTATLSTTSTTTTSTPTTGAVLRID